MTIFAGNRLKRFFSRIDLDNNRSEAHDTIRVRDALEAEEESQLRQMDDDEELVEDLKTRDLVDEED